MRKRRDLRVFVGPIKKKENKHIWNGKKKIVFYLFTLATAPSLTFLPTLLILLFLFFSSDPRPNILISDLAGFVDAKNEATKMNLDILGRAFIAAAAPSEEFDNDDDGGGSRCWSKGLESMLGSGSFD